MNSEASVKRSDTASFSVSRSLGEKGRVRVWPILWRLIRTSFSYRTGLILSLVCGVIFAGARYLRAYLAQPLIDGILVPAAAMTGEASIELFQAPLLELGAIASMAIGLKVFLGWV